jgi:protein-arginine kinase activator protein McsA
MACSALVKLQSKSENGDMDDLAPEEAMVERLLERLETGIESAVSQERFKEASALRDEISRMHMDDSSAVLKVNSCIQ